MKISKRSIILVMVLVACLCMLLFMFIACNSKQTSTSNITDSTIDDDVNSKSTDNDASITNIQGGTINGLSLNLEVDSTISQIDLSGMITVSENSSWLLYSDALCQKLIPTRNLASLKNGDNVFYIIVKSADSAIKNTYTLNIYKNYYVKISYYVDGKLFDTQNVLARTTLEDFSHPTKQGYTFVGWGCDGVFVIENTSFDATFKVDKYKVTYNLDGGNNYKYNPSTYTIKDDIVLGVPTKTGYTFLGWYSDKNFNNQVTEIEKGSYGDKTFYAKWMLSNYIITYNLDGGINNVNNPLTYTIKDQITLAIPTKDAYVKILSSTHLENTNYNVEKQITTYSFDGWYLESTYDTKVTQISGHQNVEVFAKWSSEITTTTVEQSYSPSGDYIYFGTYPQSKVLDNAIISELNSLAGTLPTSENSQEWIPYNYFIKSSDSISFMWYIDKEYDGNKYRGVYFTAFRPNRTNATSDFSEQGDNGYQTSTVYWFKYEPIKWKVLSKSNGEALVLCDMIIDSQEYYFEVNDHPSGASANDWAESTIRKWLNNNFYNTAFNDLQKSVIVEQTLLTNKYNGETETTKDNIFLLTQSDMTNNSYGYKTRTTELDVARIKKTTAYAQCQGTYTSTKSGLNGNGYCLLRSSNANNKYEVHYVNSDGNVSNMMSVYYNYSGIAPVLKIVL